MKAGFESLIRDKQINAFSLTLDFDFIKNITKYSIINAPRINPKIVKVLIKKVKSPNAL